MHHSQSMKAEVTRHINLSQRHRFCTSNLTESLVPSPLCVSRIDQHAHTHKFPNTVSGLMQWALSTVETWCNKVGLLVNPDKTGLIAFTRKRKLLGFFQPQFFGVKLSLLGSIKYLGVILDSRLTWKGHVM
jgi:hypothetical protein